ncbi:MAG TPA: 50S ribosomal protein L5 [Fimbriimonadales bacterium]|nr:50S ribosomal protein L5 [Fimbriimonadales bacterium]
MAKKEQAIKEKKEGKQAGGTAVIEKPPRSRLRDLWQERIVPEMMKEFGYTTPMQVPRIEKIVVNMGVGEATKDSKALDNSIRDLTLITGQKPVVTLAKKSISNFRIRKGMKIGCKVTLRGDRMFHFLDKLITVVLPRLRDFQGLNPRSFDGHGNYAIGLKEQLVFPEIDYETFDKIRGMDIVICTTARTDEEARALLKKMGLPFRERS